MKEEKQTRESTGFLIKQRAYLKLCILGRLEERPWYGLALLQWFNKEFKLLGYRPQHSEIYRALYDLEEEGYIISKKEKRPDSQRAEITVYLIKDKEKAKAYKKLVRVDLDRGIKILQKAVKDNYK